MPRELELLAPARDEATAIAAINHGADAVYIGAPEFGARAAASNSIESIKRVVDAAHPFGVKVYVTFNTIIYNHELKKAEQLIEDLWKIGVDALIVQDLGILNLNIPPIDLHASTQTDARSIAKIQRLADMGFSQIVLPREFTLKEIKEATAAVPGVDFEVFIHGALCVSYSGDCQAGWMLSGRSANRGECPQICRLEFALTDSKGNKLESLPDGGSAVRHWLSTADLCRLTDLRDLIEAGASSFKIEGRLKSASYVKNITLAYSKELDEIVRQSDGALKRSSFGEVAANFEPDVTRSFNRGFTSFFLRSPKNTGVTSWKTVKWAGKAVGKLISSQGNRLKVSITEEINNGDGLGYFDSDGKFKGFKVNRAEGSYLYPAPGAETPSIPGTELYRNFDKQWEDRMTRTDSARRTISVSMTLRSTKDSRIALDVRDERGCEVSVTTDEAYKDTAQSEQMDHRRTQLGRLGDTIYKLGSLDDRCGSIFIPSKALASLRRSAVELLNSLWCIRYQRPLRRPNKLAPDAFSNLTTSYHDNIANRQAENFYRSHGAIVKEKAAEIELPKKDTVVMTTRYCLRRELGACRKEASCGRLPEELWLEAPIGRLRLDFDCPSCQMKVILPAKNK